MNRLEQLVSGRHSVSVLVSIAVVTNLAIFYWPQDKTDLGHYEFYLETAEVLEAGDRNSEHASLLSDLQSVIDELDKSASPSKPLKQHLLWAGRDYLKPALAGRWQLDVPGLKKHMDAARYHLSMTRLTAPEFAPQVNRTVTQQSGAPH